MDDGDIYPLVVMSNIALSLHVQHVHGGPDVSMVHNHDTQHVGGVYDRMTSAHLNCLHERNRDSPHVIPMRVLRNANSKNRPGEPIGCPCLCCRCRCYKHLILAINGDRHGRCAGSTTSSGEEQLTMNLDRVKIHCSFLFAYTSHLQLRCCLVLRFKTRSRRRVQVD